MKYEKEENMSLELGEPHSGAMLQWEWEQDGERVNS